MSTAISQGAGPAPRIVEVSPRDGLQSEAVQVSTEVKLALIERLLVAGVTEIEVTGFVHPQRVPQLADAEQLCHQLPVSDTAQFSALVPNLQGLQRARLAGIRRLAFFTAASETFCQRNIGCSIAGSLQRCAQLKAAMSRGSWLRGYISCAFGCPYEGKVAVAQVSNLAAQMYTLGCDEIVLADTIGVATPRNTRQRVQAVSQQVPIEQLALHLHDTRGQALANIYACLDLNIAAIDASVAGLGGCPFAPGASGNLATEDLVYMLHGCGLDTGINLDALIAAGRYISEQLQRRNHSRVGVAGSVSYEC